MSKTLFVININSVLLPNTRKSFLAACDRWNCDYTEITNTNSQQHPSALKLKTFDLCRHERVFIIDTDTIIRDDTPSPFEQFSEPAFYAVRNQQPQMPKAYEINVEIAKTELQSILNKTRQFNISADILQLSSNFFNAGVWLCNRTQHEKVLDLARYFFDAAQLRWWEQMPLNLAVAIELGGYTDMGNMYNYQFPENLDTMSAYIYHFAGDPERYKKLEKVNWRTV